ncbi:divisome protein SepX/GlpR [Corynebacterium sp. A21]|uniref:divisome protein SepX/GlpR n=1 Tax=Corynebacterium sp. A21 TaxID=3457318 RepID=UPI003FD67BEB
MPGGLAIVLIIVVWLFVLAPLLLRGQKPIRKAGEAFDETRVIHEGGSRELSSRRRPRVTSADIRPRRERDDEDYELVDADDVLIDDRENSGAAGGLGGVFASASAKFHRNRTDGESIEDAAAEYPEPVVEGAVVHELEAGSATEVTLKLETETAGSAEHFVDDSYWAEDEEHYELSEAYTSPADFLDPRAALDGPREGVEKQLTEDGAPEFEDDLAATPATELRDSELSQEELEFAQRRRGRGSWDPEADEHHSLNRYQRRQRTLIGLGVAVVLTLVVAIVLGGWAYALPAIAVAATGFYLVALRSQVREEQALRRRRIRQLRRARLGVVHPGEAASQLPRQLRRPGALVLERDDESPDFEYLETRYLAEPAAAPEVAEFQRYRDRRVS